MPRILVIDEAWWLMQQEESAKFIFALVKRARKYYLGVTTITQDVGDFLGSPYGQAIVSNSAIQFLLKQSPSGVDRVVKTFNLTEGEKFLLLESGVGEGIFFAGQKHAAIKVVASYAEDQIVTTNPQQLLEMEKERKAFEASINQQADTTPSDAPAAGEGSGDESTTEASDEKELKEAAEKAQEVAASDLLAKETAGREEAEKILDSLSS